MNLPDSFDFGAGQVVELNYLEQIFGISRRAAKLYLQALRIEPIYIGKKTYFSLNTFKRIMFVLTRPGGPGMITPGSTAKNNPRYLKDPNKIFKVTDELLEQAARPDVMAEMAAAEGRNVDVIKKFMGLQKRAKKDE